MAVWQFSLHLIPSPRLMEFCGDIPVCLDPDLWESADLEHWGAHALPEAGTAMLDEVWICLFMSFSNRTPSGMCPTREASWIASTACPGSIERQATRKERVRRDTALLTQWSLHEHAVKVGGERIVAEVGLEPTTCGL